MTPISFFTDDLALVPHSVSSELADLIEKPVTLAEFTKRTGNQPVAVYQTESGEIYAVARPRQPMNAAPIFIEGPAAA